MVNSLDGVAKKTKEVKSCHESLRGILPERILVRRAHIAKQRVGLIIERTEEKIFSSSSLPRHYCSSNGLCKGRMRQLFADLMAKTHQARSMHSAVSYMPARDVFGVTASRDWMLSSIWIIARSYPIAPAFSFRKTREAPLNPASRLFFFQQGQMNR
jgi:hypothetical protein